jgi:serine/threonine protein kinase/tetratricopeptide (TPR) repeat protein
VSPRGDRKRADRTATAVTQRRAAASGTTSPATPVDRDGRREEEGIGPGRVLAGRYFLEAELGRGAVGVVFRAYDRAIQTRVAIKVVRPEIAGRRSWLGQLGREVRHARDVQHPNVCRIFELAEADGFTFLTMELAARGSLRGSLGARGRRGLGERLADARGLAEGMAAIHRAGIVHRDLKPDNVLRMRDGRLVVSDFGVARGAHAAEDPDKVGTPAYMAPEVARAEAATTASDVWAMGIVLHEILFHCHPGQPPKPSTTDPHAAALRALCLDCVAQEPRERPPDAEEVLARLDELDGETLDQRLERGTLGLGEAVSVAARLLELVASTSGPPGGGPAIITPARILLLRRPGAPVRLLPPPPPGSPLHDEASYASPEVCRQEAGDELPGDIFAVGCVLHEALTGHPPDGGGPRLEVSARRALGQSVDMSAEETDLPGVLRRLLHRMLDPDPARRPRDAHALAAKLRAMAAAAERRTNSPTPPAALDGLTAERRVCTVAAFTPVGHDDRANPLEDDSSAGVAQPVLLRHVAEGVAIALFTGPDTPRDTAFRAARWALSRRDSAPGSSVALTIGTSILGAVSPVDLEASKTLLGRCGHGSVALDQATADLLGTRFEIERSSPLRLMAQIVRDERPRTVLGKDIPCVGRDREIQALVSLWEEVVDQPVARAVLVTAPAGAGKSRVRQALLERLQSGQARFDYLLGRGDSVRAGAPFGMLGAGLRAAAGLIGGEAAEIQQRRLQAHVARHIPLANAHRVAAFVGEIAGIHFPDQDLPRLRAARQDPRLMADQTLAAWLDLIEAECAAHPLLLVLEDLHWGDVPSVQLVDAALRTQRERPLMVLALARPEVDQKFPGMWAERDLQRIALPPLTPKSALRLVQHALPSLPPVKAIWIVERAHGHPFFLEELIRAVGEGGEATDGTVLPESVLGMVQARFDALGADAKRILRAAAIFGRTFQASGVRAVLGEQDRSVERWVEVLVSKEIVFPREASDASRFVFRHALVQEAAYAMLAPEDRVTGHRNAGEYLERQGEREAIVLVDHFETGERREKAAHWCAIAAEQALQANDLAAVIERVRRAERLGLAGEGLGRLRIVEAQAHFWRGEYAQCEAAALAATEVLDGVSRLQAIRELLSGLGQQAKFDQVERWARELHGRRPARLEVAAWLECLVRAAAYLVPGGRYSAARDLLVELDQNQELLNPPSRARLDVVHAMEAWFDGDHVNAGAFYQAAACRYEESGDDRFRTEMAANLASIRGELGLLEECAQGLGAVLGSCERMQVGYVAAFARMNLCALHGLLGRFGEAQRDGEAAINLSRQQGDPRIQGGTTIYLSLNASFQGRHGQAESYARVAIALLEGVPPFLPMALAALAQALLRQGRVDEAMGRATKAFETLQSLGRVEDGEALTRLVYAECLLAMDRADEARQVIADAAERLQRRASKISDPDWRRTFLQRLPVHARILALQSRLA